MGYNDYEHDFRRLLFGDWIYLFGLDARVAGITGESFLHSSRKDWRKIDGVPEMLLS